MAAIVGAIESFEDLLPLEGRNPRPIVRHAKQKPGRVRLGGDRNETASRCEFDRIVDEVGDRFDQEVEIAEDRKRLPRFERKGDLLGFR